MESTYNILAAAWLGTWLIAQYRIFIPSMLILREFEPTNICYRWWPAVWIIFGVGSFITIPILLLPVLSDTYRDTFVKGYVNSLLKIEL